VFWLFPGNKSRKTEYRYSHNCRNSRTNEPVSWAWIAVLAKKEGGTVHQYAHKSKREQDESGNAKSRSHLLADRAFITDMHA
jgi:hypothetical protein